MNHSAAELALVRSVQALLPRVKLVEERSLPGFSDVDPQDTREVVSANPALLTLARARRVLLLQGPVGPFFDRLTRWLRNRGGHVERVAFQQGDAADCQEIQPIRFHGSVAQWPAYFERLATERRPDCVVLFGQMRVYHRIAREIAGRLGITTIVTEEGYIRPGYITMEIGGVNGLSTTLDQFRWQPLADHVHHAPAVSGRAPLIALPPAPRRRFLWQKMAWHAASHYFSMRRGLREFDAYTHHRATSVLHYSSFWVASFTRKYFSALPDRASEARLTSLPYFFVPLQHDGDSQITHHSPYRENTDFILEVMRSFADYAPAGALLVFKQHPQARGGLGHQRLIHAVAKEFGISERVVHLIEGHTPSLVAGALGVVVINSTVGLQALARKRPVMALGDALYGRPGLAFMGPLHQFWLRRPSPDSIKVDWFLEQLRRLTQVPCHVYDRREEPLTWFISPTSEPEA
ncbi:MAG TPA: capsule polysaccharide biosynthesis [Ramlibacter sp.]|nr:capsule polysaccharide biosynthesis [Ramlibacter sp.]